MIEVSEVEQYRNLATVTEKHGRKCITLAVRTELEGRALEVAVAEALNAATVIEFQIGEIAKAQPWKIQAKWEQMQPQRQVVTVNGQSIAKIVEKKRAAGGDEVIG
jgi:hypothetical protein